MANVRESGGNLLRRWREVRRLTQAALGRALGLSGAAVSEWELGKSDMDAARRESAAEALRVPDDQRAEFYLRCSGHSEEVTGLALQAYAGRVIQETELRGRGKRGRRTLVIPGSEVEEVILKKRPHHRS